MATPSRDPPDLHDRLDLPPSQPEREHEHQTRRREGCEGDGSHRRDDVAPHGEDGVEQLVHHVDRLNDLHALLAALVAPAEDDAGSRVARNGDEGRERVARRIVVEVEGRDVLRCDLVVLDDRSIGGDAIPVPGQDRAIRARRRQVPVAVTETLDDPGRLDVDEDGLVVGTVGGGQHPRHAHLQGVDTGQVEHALGRRDHRVARTHPETLRAASLPSTHSPRRAICPPRGHFAARARRSRRGSVPTTGCVRATWKPHVEGDRVGQAGYSATRPGLGPAREWAPAAPRLEVERAQGTSSSGLPLRARAGAGWPRPSHVSCVRALPDQHVQARRQERDQRDGRARGSRS